MGASSGMWMRTLLAEDAQTRCKSLKYLTVQNEVNVAWPLLPGAKLRDTLPRPRNALLIQYALTAILKYLQ